MRGLSISLPPATPEQVVAEQERITGLSRHQIAALNEQSTPPGRPGRYDPEDRVWRDVETGEVMPTEPDAAWIAGGLDD